MLIDTHCHLDYPEYDADRDQMFARAREQGVELVVNVGSSVQGSLNSVELAKKYPFVYAVVGCHPHDAKDCKDQDIQAIREMATAPKVVAIGEIGLDYYRNLSPAEIQRELFAKFIRMAKELDLPAVLHSRQAEADTLEIVKKEGLARAIVHCFSGDEAFLKACLDLGYYVSFTANITYKKAQNLRDIIKIAPLDRICVETDAPYLSPEGYRGKRNEPIYVKMVAECIAQVKGLSFAQVAEATTRNAKSFFNITI